MNKIILIGAGGHAKSCIDVIEKEKKYKIIGLVDKDLNKKNVLNYPVIGSDNDIDLLFKKSRNVLITVGQIKSSLKRIQLYNKYKKYGFTFPIIKSPLSYVSKHSTIAEGTIIMHNVIINSACKIGINCIINSKALIEHDVEIGNFCHISTSCVLNGNIKAGNGIFIGSNSTVSNLVKIKDNEFIPAMSFIKE